MQMTLPEKTVIEGERLTLSPIANQAFFCFLSFLFSFNVFLACFFGFSLLISVLSVINSAADRRFIKTGRHFIHAI